MSNKNKQRKILDVVLDCIEQGIDSKAVVEGLRKKGLLIEPKKCKKISFNDYEMSCNEINNEISSSEWERLENDYYARRFGSDN